MGHEAYVLTENVIWWKQGVLALLGFLIRIIWDGKFPWLRILSGLLFMVAALYFNGKWVSATYREEIACCIGLFTNKIIVGLFRWWKVNEDGLMEKTKKWWNSDKPK